MAYPVINKPIGRRNLPWQFGDGSDGTKTVGTNETLTKTDLNYVSLTILQGRTLSVPAWAHDKGAICVIRAQDFIEINGTLSATGVTRKINNNGVFGDVGTASDGLPPGLHISAGVTHMLYDFTIWPVVGGGGSADGNDAFVARGETDYAFFPAGYTSQKATGGSPAQNGNDIIDSNFDRDEWIGPGRPFRYCAGGGGGGNTSARGGNGGGIIILYAPRIIFGASGKIEAKGEGGRGTNTGGGGGGYVEIWTSYALSDADKAKVDVSGGAGNGDGGDGADGHKVFRILR